MIVAAAHRKKTPGLESNPTESDLQSFNSAFYYIKYRRDTSARLCWLQKSLYITSAVCFVASLWSKLKACWMMSSRRSSPSVCYIAAVHVKGNTSSIVPPLIPWLLDITVSHVCIINEVKPTGSWKHDRAERRRIVMTLIVTSVKLKIPIIVNYISNHKICLNICVMFLFYIITQSGNNDTVSRGIVFLQTLKIKSLRLDHL